MKEIISLSKGNTKLGKTIPNISLPPIKSCVSGVPCSQKSCYALKAYRQYPNTKEAWDKNFRIFLANPEEYFNQIVEYLQNKKPEYFRWHVGGDIPDIRWLNLNTRYLMGMIRVAYQCPQTKFLAFTKNYRVISGIPSKELPSNLSIVISAWPKYRLPQKMKDQKYKIAWYDDGTETRYSKKFSTVCSGKCDNCLSCWEKEISSRPIDVILKAH